ncbi:MAG TPA: tetratricopeptide repeat protein [Cyclobacteriaceae bacterium]|nr:tetratricopeptide repeat protein [Cyclobacteriaceae bacterium]
MKRPFLYIFSLILLVPACSPQSTSVTSKAFHNTTAHYNGYFYAREEITAIEKTILTSEDDYNNILPLYPTLDSVKAKGYDKGIQEAIKMASLSIQRHPNSKWVDDCYILVGKARLYSLDWGNAIQTFKYVNTKSKNIDKRHEAIIHLGRTFTEHGEYNNAEAAFDFLKKEKLSKVNRKLFHLEQAHYYQIRDDYDNMVRNLTQAVPLLTRKDRPGRVYFIIGQVYQQLGFESEAFNFYRECISTNPEYEVDFYARLYMAQVAEISRSRNIASARKSFKKLLKDSKNKDFRDKIYYEMGVFERKQKNLDEAITNYNLSIREGTNKIIDGQAYWKLGEIYYDTLKNFQLSQAYYDSAVSALPTTFENYEAIQARQKVLNEFVENLNTISWQDSLLVMAKMDTATLRKHIASVLDSQKKPEVKTKRKKRNRVEINTVNSSIATESNLEASNWYFGNPSSVALGQSEFTRIWGARPLEDNWRRSTRTTTITKVDTNQSSNQNEKGTTDQPQAPARSPLEEAYDRISKELPHTEEQVAAANKKIEDAYFRLGDIYYFDLKEKENAVASYDALLTRYPKTEYYPESLYKLYLIFKDSDPAKANLYAAQLKEKFPESTFAKILINPNYLQESGLAVEKQKFQYQKAYDLYQSGDYTRATQLINETIALEKSTFIPNLELLKVLIVGKTENISQYQFALDKFIKDYPESELIAYAQTLLQSSRDFQLKREKEKGIQYIASFDEPHYFVLVSDRESDIADVATKTLEGFNSSNFKDSNLKVSSLILNDSYTLTLVSDLPNQSSALEYYKSFIEKRSTLTGLKDYKFSNFVITKDNFDIFYRTKGLDEYLQFFEKNYKPENP